MTACSRVDCGGAISGDGYCDTCGFPRETKVTATPPPPSASTAGPVAAPPPPSGPAAAPADPPSDPPSLTVTPASSATPTGIGSACRQPDCSGGTIAADGYCTTCGASGENAAQGHTVAPDGSARTAPSIAVPTAPAVSARTTGGTRRTLRLNSQRTGTQLGLGLVTVPPTAVSDPSGAVMSEAKIQAVLGAVPEEKRHCAACGRDVGRSEDGEAGRVTGFCGTCRTPFDFITNSPALKTGDLVAGQYKILGPLAHGGMGWIYLGQDTAVSNRWVVLKGLLNAEDADAIASAVAERQFLAQIEHGNIVNIYNFVTWGGAGYIVMEFVGGESLNSKLKHRREENGGVPNPLPVTDAISYILGILPALGYLHRLGLVYNDLKPANVMATADGVKLIDVGGVMRMTDTAAAIFGTQGFQAPEVASHGPSVASDLYTVGRTLAVLMLNFVFHAGPYQYALPNQAEEPLFAQWETLYRFLLKATAAHPDDRFQSADEMTLQLTGVLRAIVALTSGVPRPVTSSYFGGDRLTDLLHDQNEEGATVRPEWRALPLPLVNPADPASKFLEGLPEDAAQGRALIEAGVADGQIPSSPEVALRHSQLLAESSGQPESTLSQIEAADPWEWRVQWIRGVVALRDGQPALAAEKFSRVWTELPGEIAPQLAVAVASEMAKEYERAASLYGSVVAVDPTFVSASFGLARCRVAAGNQPGAIDAYGLVPSSSATYVDAQVSMVRTMVFERPGGIAPKGADLAAASTIIARLQLSARERSILTADILQQTLTDLASGTTPADSTVKIFDAGLTETTVRIELEITYRELAQLARTGDERALWVDRANSVRPFSIF